MLRTGAAHTDSALKSNLSFLALAAVTVFLRVLWIQDMEWKGDEKDTALWVKAIGWWPDSALAPISFNSGIAHSSVAPYFMKWISLGGATAISIVLGIALFNSAAIIVSLLLLRKSERGLLLIFAWASHLTLVLHSRKIWTPDLLPGWSILSVGLLVSGLESEDESKLSWKLILSALCIFISGHMYLPGALTAAVISTSVAFVLYKKHSWTKLQSWIIGCCTGSATFIPYFIALLTHPEKAFGHRNAPRSIDLIGIWKLVSSSLTLPAPGTVFVRYIRSNLESISQSSPFLAWTLGLCGLLSFVLWSLSFWIALVRLFKQREVDPLQEIRVATIAAAIVFPLVLALSGLGHYLHYWLSAIPLGIAFTVLSGVSKEKITPPIHLRIIQGACIFSMLSSFSLEYAVHQNHGLPIEYGPTYQGENH